MPPGAEATQIVRTQPKRDEPIDVFNLVGFGDPVHADLNQAWAPRSDEDRYRIPIGLDDHGRPVHLDLKKCVSGVGIFGAAGSGKSELLRTILFGLAATHSSTLVNFACINREHDDHVWRFIEQLPHTALVAPMLNDSLTGRRLDDALIGEIHRQRELFDRLKAKNFVDYERMQPETESERIPMLLLAIDDLPDVLRARPEFAETLNLVTRLRMSGVKLLFTAESEAEVPRHAGRFGTGIALRTTEPDSVKAIGRPWANDLPKTPGHGYLKPTFEDSPIRFRAAYTDLPHGKPEDEYHQTNAEVFADRVRSQAPPAGRSLILPPPGVQPVGLNTVLPAPEVTDERGFNAQPVSPLNAAIGVLDVPYHHRHDPLQIDFAGPDGNLAVVGRPRSGKTTAAQTTLLALALTHTPAEVRFHCLDFGGGGLELLRDLPHTRAVAASHDANYVARTVGGLEDLLAKREKSFTRYEIDSIDGFRRRRESEALDEEATDHFLTIDGWPEVHQHPGLAHRIMRLAQRGLSYGIHVIVTANHWDDLPRTLRELCGRRVELRLAEPESSPASREHAPTVAKAPGQGVYEDLLCAISAPVLDDSVLEYLHPDSYAAREPRELAPKIREVVQQIDEAWKRERPRRLRRPPATVEYDELPTAKPDAFPLGVDDRGRPVTIDFTGDNPRHLLIMGGRESGRSTVIRNVLRSIANAYQPKEALVLLVDYARQHHNQILPETHLLAYDRSPDQTESHLKDVIASLRKRESADRKGPKVFLVADDFHLLLGGSLAKLGGLDELLPRAGQIGLHLITTVYGVRRSLWPNVLPELLLSSYHLVLKDAFGPEWLLSRSSETPQEPGEALLRPPNGPETSLRIPWIPHPLREGKEP